jgi:hypothetical protein
MEWEARVQLQPPTRVQDVRCRAYGFEFRV